MTSLKNRLFKHKRKIITFIAVSLFIVSMYTPIFLSSQPSTNINYLQTLLLNNLPINNNVNAKDSWLSGWNCRKIHTINGSIAGAQTNYQMRITVHYGSGTDSGENVYCNAQCRYDFGDVRFTNSDGTTPLDYWMESKTDSDKATFWVEVDSIPASPSTINIYVYYGKSDASTTSNAQNTFTYFQDFGGSSLPSGWSVRLNEMPGGGWTVSGSELKIWSDTTGGGWRHIVIQYGTAIGKNMSILSKVTEIRQYPGGGGKTVSINWNSNTSNGGKYWDYTEGIFTGGMWDNSGECFETRRDNTYGGGYSWSSPRYQDNDVIEIARTPSKALLYWNHNLYRTVDNNSVPNDDNLWLSYSVDCGSSPTTASEIHVDWVAIRSYVDPEPTHGSLGNQEYPHPWLSGWAYCKPHTIVGSSAGVQTNYQMRITVHYGSGTDSGENVYCNAHCRYDFGDVRFTKSDGTTLLDYWLESKTDGDKATFWVEVDSIPADPNIVNIYVYYGNANVSTTSNGGNTFVLFDDFNTLNTSTWNSSDLVDDACRGWAIENGNLVLYVGTRGKSKVWIVGEFTFTNNYYDLDNRIFEINTNMSMGGTLYGGSPGYTMQSGIGFGFMTSGDAQKRLYSRHEGTNHWLRYADTGTPPAVLWSETPWSGAATGYHVLGLRRNGNEIQLYENQALKTT